MERADLNNLTVIAIGGHSLLDPHLAPTVENQFVVTSRAMIPIVELVLRGERLLLTHGNGPQVGFMQLRSELARAEVHEVPLDSLVANTQGSLGYMIQRALREQMLARGLHNEVVTVVTEVEVDPDDRAFEEPTKPIGRFYSEEEAAVLTKTHGWRLVSDAGRGFRRVVPSPSPVRIVQQSTIRQLSENGATVVCCGGGGIPIFRSEGKLQGLPAVIDKDRTTALLAVSLGAARLVITTGVDAVYRDYLKETRQKLSRLNVAELRQLVDAGQFPPGSMLPKMEAAVYYLNRIPGEVIICMPSEIVEALDGRAGTRITR